ncbi:MAG: GGDEF domain-containing protein [Clostridiales bacterium]|nr:GGDEF domain-containing protein [Clostridiales bacterium]
MAITASIYTDIYAIIMLIITIWLASKNPIGNKTANRIFVSMLMLTIVLLLLEISTILMGLSNESKFVVPHRIANVLGFSLSPLVPFILSGYPSDKKRRIKNKYYVIPLYINIIMCLMSYKTGWIFFVDETNNYYRGDLFLIPMLTSTFYFINLLVYIKRNITNYKNEYNKLINLMCFLPMVGAILQIAFEDLLLVWGSMAISLVIYYMILREIQFRYDPQTGIKNRLAFEKEMKKYISSGKSASIIVLDINNLKIINDKYGHKEGDDLIISAAKIIKESFLNLGEAFRIGGDEFCVICEGTRRVKVENAIERLEELIAKTNKNRTIKIDLAYGYDFYRKDKGDSIYSVFSKADSAMYVHKAKSKGLYNRKIIKQ